VGLRAFSTGFEIFVVRLEKLIKDPQAPSRETLRKLGHITWGLFYIQLSTFALGVLALSAVLLLTYGGKLI